MPTSLKLGLLLSSAKSFREVIYMNSREYIYGEKPVSYLDDRPEEVFKSPTQSLVVTDGMVRAFADAAMRPLKTYDPERIRRGLEAALAAAQHTD